MTLNCEVEAASDSDHWTQGSTAGDAADPISYSWYALGGTIALDSSDPRKATWTAPQQVGPYTLTCRIDDQWTTGNEKQRLCQQPILARELYCGTV